MWKHARRLQPSRNTRSTKRGTDRSSSIFFLPVIELVWEQHNLQSNLWNVEHCTSIRDIAPSRSELICICSCCQDSFWINRRYELGNSDWSMERSIANGRSSEAAKPENTRNIFLQRRILVKGIHERGQSGGEVICHCWGSCIECWTRDKAFLGKLDETYGTTRP